MASGGGGEESGVRLEVRFEARPESGLKAGSSKRGADGAGKTVMSSMAERLPGRPTAIRVWR